MTGSRSFARSFDSIPEIFEFSSEFFARRQVDLRLLPAVDLVVEELFTNMVKYSPGGGGAVRIDLEKVDGGVEVTLTDTGVEPFDVTRAPDVDIHRPIEERTPGGLGLHLVRRLVDSWDYEYSTERRESRIRFRKTLAGGPAPAAAGRTGGGHAGH